LGQRFTQWGNPKLALILALIENLATLSWIAVMNGDLLTLLKYTCMILAVKVLPLYLVWGRPIRVPQDIYVFMGVFVLYNMYLWLNDESLITIYRRTFTSIVQRDNQTPLFGLVQYLGNALHIDHALLAYF
jgi:prepilin signal peptidase PulO-like enzyme (type II secretory pathway)